MDGSMGFLTKFYEVLWDECFIVFQPSFSVVFMHPCVDLVELHSSMSSIFVAKELGLFVEDWTLFTQWSSPLQMSLYNNQQRFVYMFQPVEKALNNKYDPLFLWFYEMLSMSVSEYCVLKNGGSLVMMNELPVLVFLETLQEKLVQKSFEISEISEVPEMLSISAKILIGIVPFVSYVLMSKTMIAVITWWLGG